MITTISRSDMSVLRSEVNAAIAAVATKHGLVMALGSGKFNEKNASFKLEISTKDQNTGMVKSREATSFEVNAHFYGFKAEDLGATFKSNGRTFKITGLNTRRPKFPLLAVCVEDGRTYKFPDTTVLACLGRKK
jgi:hypothetical protein